MSELGYKDEVKIDKFALDEEWLHHPAIFMKWAEKAADAVYDRDKAKERLDFIEAELDADVRSGWNGYCPDQKMTESGVTAWVRRQPMYREAVENLNTATRTMNIMIAAKVAFEHRKKALEKLTELFMAGHYSRPVVSQQSKYQAEQAHLARSTAALGDNPRVMGRRRPAPPPPSETDQPLPGTEG